MHRVQALGGFFTVLGVVGYVIGVLAAYPGRAFSVAGVMVGITLFSVGGGLR
jgi:hypothetical protein